METLKRYEELSALGLRIPEIEASDCSRHPTIEMAVVSMAETLGLSRDEALDFTRTLEEILGE